MISHRTRARPRRRAAVVEPPTLLQFVVLSMLLHVLLIVLFGNPTGGMRRNDGGRGPLDVTLRRLSPEPGTGFRLMPGEDTNSPGSALLPPSGAASNVPAEPLRRAVPPPPQPPAPVDALPRLNPRAPEEVDKRLAPSALSPATIERVAPPDRQREFASPAELPPRVVPALPAAPIEKAFAPRREPQLAPPVELPPRAVPAAPAAPLERAAPPTLERELAPATELPAREAPVVPAAPLERVAPAKLEQEIAPPVELPVRESPLAPAAPLERFAPASNEHEVAPAVQVPPARAAPAASAPSPRSVPAETGAQAQPPAPSAPPRPRTLPAEPLPGQRTGAPEANEDIFKPRPDLGTSPAEAPHIDLDAARKKAAREIVSEGAGPRGVFTIPPPPPRERKSKEAMALEKAIKPDCRTAYADMGLLAAPVLIASAIAADGSCRW